MAPTLRQYIDNWEVPDYVKIKVKESVVCPDKGGWDLDEPPDADFYNLTDQHLLDLGVETVRYRIRIMRYLQTSRQLLIHSTSRKRMEAAAASQQRYQSPPQERDLPPMRRPDNSQYAQGYPSNERYESSSRPYSPPRQRSSSDTQRSGQPNVINIVNETPKPTQQQAPQPAPQQQAQPPQYGPPPPQYGPPPPGYGGYGGYGRPYGYGGGYSGYGGYGYGPGVIVEPVPVGGFGYGVGAGLLGAEVGLLAGETLALDALLL